ncbi:MAG: hypothetical protein JNM38_03205, partial [Acidobacteria bacterium]|nr:hypothetical protein [Acidobacteriota bacterium]
MRNGRRLVWAMVVWAMAAGVGRAQERSAPTLRVGPLPEDVHIDGRLDEPAWQSADLVDAFTQTDPSEGAPPS